MSEPTAPADLQTRALAGWATLGLGAVGLTLVLAGAPPVAALAGGSVAAAIVALSGFRLNRASEKRIGLYASAARGHVPLYDDVHQQEPTQLARAVQSTAENAREMSRKLSVLRAVIDGMAEGVWITDEDGRVIEHNNALKEMLYAGREIVGQRADELLSSSELQDAVEKACRESQSARLELAVEGVRPRVLSIHISPLGRELGGSAAVFFDVTELRRLEKVRKDFVANVSHELRTPITAIRGYAETLKSGALSDPVNAPQMVDIIHRQSERLSELVEDLLEISRLESKQLQLTQKPIDLADAAARALETVRPKSKARNTELVLTVPPGLWVLGDQRAIEQVVLNLVDNAVKYTPANSHVTIGATRAGAEVVLTVRDDGPGIDARHLPRLFERFYRVDKGRSRDMGGTGLGLSIVKHLVNGMQGEVRVESTPGQGSTFSVTMRAAPAGQVASPEPPESGVEGVAPS
jgi:two-component system phosphate regulon sensor histidine kinase PhoR